MDTKPLNTNGPGVIAAKREDALGIYSFQFKTHLEGLGYSRHTVAEYGRRIRTLGELMRKHRVALPELSELKTAELLAKHQWPPSRRKYAGRIVGRFVRFLGEQGVTALGTTLAPEDDDRARLRGDYETYLRQQRGLSERTIQSCWRLADQFLVFRFGNKIGNLSAIAPMDIAVFIHQLHSRKRPYRVKTTSTHLRQFCRYLFKAGQIKTNLALGIPSVTQRYGSRLRRHLTPEQVETVVAAVRSDTPTGRRNYAIILLLARLGLRAPEVIAMQMDDVDWRAGEIIVRGKGQRHDRVPLPAEVGEAMAEYIRRDRVTTFRAVFVADHAPHRPFKDGQILNGILTDAFAKTGVKPPAPYVGSHVLRHSLATHLAQKGASLDEIGDMLRHRSRASTMIYAKLDIEGLRSIAQPWPVAGGVK
jgi:site-specific recombinase XerD